MEKGSITLEGNNIDLLDNPSVLSTYLGR